MFSTSTVASSTRIDRQCESTERHNIDRFSDRAKHNDGGQDCQRMEVAMMTVLRQLPRKARIMKAVRHAAISVSGRTPLIAPRTKMD